MDVFKESINDITTGSEQKFGTTGGICVAVGVNTVGKVATIMGKGVSVETYSRKFVSGVVGLAELPRLQLVSRNIPDNVIRNAFFIFTTLSFLIYIPSIFHKQNNPR